MEQQLLQGPLVDRLFYWGGGGVVIGTIGGGVLGEVFKGPDSPSPQRWAFRGGIYLGLLGLLIVAVARVHI